MSAVRLDLQSFSTEYLSNDSLNSAKTWIESSFLEHHTNLFKLVLLASIILSIIYTVIHFPTYDDDLPIVNRRFALEPRLFARIRWATKSRNILEDANEKVRCIGVFSMTEC